MATKAELRTLYKEKRRQLEPAQWRQLSEKVVKHALVYLAVRPQIQHIHVFLPIKRLYEIDTLPLIDVLAQKGKAIYTSISDHDKQQMKTIRVAADHDYKEDKYGIPVPTTWEKGDEAMVQLIFIPLLAYDLKGHRLGYGKGFYDRFLSQFPKEVVKAGLSLFTPEDKIPTEPHDVPLDICINPDGVRTFSI